MLASGFDWTEGRTAIWTLSILSGTFRTLLENALGARPAPNGSSIAFMRGAPREIWLMGPSGEEPHKLRGPEGEYTIQRVEWFPDGKRLAYLRTSQTEVAIGSSDLEGNQSVVYSDSGLRTFCVGPDGRIFCSLAESPPDEISSNLWEIRTDLLHRQAVGEPRRLTNWVRLSAWSPSVSLDGKHLTFIRRYEQSDIYVGKFEKDVGLTGARRLTLDDRIDWPAGWMRDSTSILFYSDRHGNFDTFNWKDSRSGSAAMLMGRSIVF